MTGVPARRAVLRTRRVTAMAFGAPEISSPATSHAARRRERVLHVDNDRCDARRIEFNRLGPGNQLDHAFLQCRPQV
jgi:hypothetical protein